MSFGPGSTVYGHDSARQDGGETMVTAIKAAEYVRPTPFEVAAGWMHGMSPATVLPATSTRPRAALDQAILPSLVNGPCFVSFSGGRDSSAVLAAATALARREGLPEPIPVTSIYVGDAGADESEWQRLVIDHLGLSEWLRIELSSDQADLLGETARGAVGERGVLWPPALQTQGAVFRHLRGGVMLTGEGGDATLGSRRVTPLTLLRRGRRPNRQLLAWAGHALAPRPLRGELRYREYRSASFRPWLRPEFQREHHRRLAEEDASEPLRYDTATWWILRKRMWTVMSHNQVVAAAEFGVRTSDPLLDPEFLAALAHLGGRWGFAGRTATMKALFADVLPAAVLSRTSKAHFNTAYSGAATREFAATWDGAGVDDSLVDVERLREAWLSDTPTMSAALLLHSAWLACRPDRPE